MRPMSRYHTRASRSWSVRVISSMGWLQERSDLRHFIPRLGRGNRPPSIALSTLVDRTPLQNNLPPSRFAGESPVLLTESLPEHINSVNISSLQGFNGRFSSVFRLDLFWPCRFLFRAKSSNPVQETGWQELLQRRQVANRPAHSRRAAPPYLDPAPISAAAKVVMEEASSAIVKSPLYHGGSRLHLRYRRYLVRGVSAAILRRTSYSPPVSG